MRLSFSSWPGVPRSVAVLPLLSAASVAASGCGTDSFKPVPTAERSQLYWALELKHHAAILSTTAPWDTLTLAATPHNPDGAPLTGLPAPTYTSNDISKVIVSPEGVVQAVAPLVPGTTVLVIATLTYQNIRHADTARINVVADAPPPELASFSVHPIPPDSAKVAASQAIYGNLMTDTLPVRALAADGSTISTSPGSPAGILPIEFRSSDTTIVRFDTRNGVLEVLGYQPGTAMIYAATTAFGITKADTLPYRIGWPLTTAVDVVPPEGVAGRPGAIAGGSGVFRSSEVGVGVGGVVFWFTKPLSSGSFGDTTLVADVTFADADLPNVQAFDAEHSSAIPMYWFFYCSGLVSFFASGDCGAGNFIVGPNHHILAARRFPVAGTYEYRSTLNEGSVGRVVVVDER